MRFAGVARGGYISPMTTVSIRKAKNRLTELARRVERGETVVVTRNRRPVLDLVPHQPRTGLDLRAVDRFKAKYGIAQIVPGISPDFDGTWPRTFFCSHFDLAVTPLAACETPSSPAGARVRAEGKGIQRSNEVAKRRFRRPFRPWPGIKRGFAVS